MLELQDVAKVYRTEDLETHALEDVSLKIGAGEFVAIMGPSGCGKSTLLNLLGLLDVPSRGSMLFHGEEIVGASERTLTRLRSAHIGFVFQNFNLIEDLTVAENVEVGLLYRGGSGDRRTKVQSALERVGLAHRAKHRPQQLSGGQQQRAAVARALVSEPALILADEPTGNLDTVNGEGVMSLLSDASKAGVTVVMVTHSAAQAAEAARQINLLDGRIVSQVRSA